MSICAQFHLPYSGFALDVDLTLPGRGVTALFGPSGSGKTTLLRCIAGLESSAQGQLEIGGETWQKDGFFLPTHKRPLGYVFQEARLFPHLTVAGNLDFGKKRVASDRHRVAPDHAVELLGIGNLLERLPEKLSGGERQRVAIARTLLTSPSLLLMDEPMAALDVGRKNEILPYLERLHDELEIPVLYVSHAPDEVARLADHIVVMEAGRAVAQGPLAETLARLDLPVRLGDDAGVVLDGRVVERDENWHLARIEFDGGTIWTRDGGHTVGQRVRIRVLARDVSIALEETRATSILNTLSATVAEIGEEAHPALALVKLQIGASAILARLTRRSVCGLELRSGRRVFVQIKAVAVI